MIYLQLAILAVMFVFSACVVAKRQFCLSCQRDVCYLLFHAFFGTYAMGRIYCLAKFRPEVSLGLIALELIVALLICTRFLLIRYKLFH